MRDLAKVIFDLVALIQYDILPYESLLEPALFGDESFVRSDNEVDATLICNL